MVSQRDLLDKWEANVAVWDCWFANQKRLYDAQRQEPDEMRWLHLANQQWVQEEEERRLEEELQRKRRRTDGGQMAEHATRANAAWLKDRIDALQRLLKVEGCSKSRPMLCGGGSRSQPTFSMSGFQTKPTSVAMARFKFKTGALHEWLGVETDALYDRIVGEEVTFHDQLQIEAGRLHEQIKIDADRLREMTIEIDAHCKRLVSKIDALQELWWGQTWA